MKFSHDIGFRQCEVERMAIAFRAAMNVAIVMLIPILCKDALNK
jgi:hypothetical protein